MRNDKEPWFAIDKMEQERGRILNLPEFSNYVVIDGAASMIEIIRQDRERLLHPFWD